MLLRAAVYFCFGLFSDLDGSDADLGLLTTPIEKHPRIQCLLIGDQRTSLRGKQTLKSVGAGFHYLMPQSSWIDPVQTDLDPTPEGVVKSVKSDGYSYTPRIKSGGDE